MKAELFKFFDRFFKIRPLPRKKKIVGGHQVYCAFFGASFIQMTILEVQNFINTTEKVEDDVPSPLKIIDDTKVVP